MNWKRVFTSAKGIVAFALSVVTLTSGVVMLRNYLKPPPSRTEIAIAGFSSDATRLLISAKNNGKQPSRIHALRNFTLSMNEPNVLELGPLTLLAPNLFREVPAGGDITLEFAIDNIRSGLDVHTDEFWALHGGKMVTLKGKVEESNGTREVEIEKPLHDLKMFVQRRCDRIDS